MTLLFLMRHSGYLRNFQSTLQALLERGHRIHVAFQREARVQQLDPGDMAAEIARRFPGFTYGEAPARHDAWGLAGQELRRALDYLRYLRPEYRDATKLRERASRDVPDHLLEPMAHGLTGTAIGRRLYGAWLRAQDQAIPPDPRITDYVRELAPDVMAVTPLIETGAPQADYVRAARALGIPVALCVASWDNLTNKGIIHGPVDVVTVWNEAMQQEAVQFHGIRAGAVVVTGAAAFDHWFDWQPSLPRDAFAAHVGLPAGRPYLLYLCSSRFVAPHEVPFIRQWLGHLRRSSSPALREIGVLVRPHPQNAAQWQGTDLDDPLTAVWPRAGAAPVDSASRSEYYDSMYHSAAVVGVNTTAEIESAIVGRRAFTVLADEFRETQEGTLHFHHLRQRGGGLLRVGRDFDEHLAQLAMAIERPEAERAACANFVRAFVRPHGLDVAATPRMVGVLEQLAQRPRRGKARRPWLAPMWSRFVLPRLAERGRQLERDALAAAEARAAKQLSRAARAARRAGVAETRQAAPAAAPGAPGATPR